jgi:hypothetical protein
MVVEQVTTEGIAPPPGTIENPIINTPFAEPARTS